MKMSANGVFWSVTARYAIGLLLIAVTSILAWTNLHSLIEHNSSTGAVMNVSGQQQMLSQRIVLFAGRLSEAKSPDELIAFRRRLTVSINRLERNHAVLTGRTEAQSLQWEMSPDIRRLYFDGAVSLDVKMAAFIAAARQVLERNDANLDGGAPLAFLEEVGLVELLAQLNAVVDAYQANGEAAVARLGETETLILVLTLTLLTLEATFIFAPMARRVSRMTGAQIAARRQAENARRLADAILDSAPHGMALVRPDGVCFKVNKAMCELTGYTEEHFLQADRSKMQTGAGERAAADAMASIMAAPHSASRLIQEWRTSNGEIRTVDVSIAPVLDEAGAVDHFVFQSVDLTEWRQVEALAEKTEQYKAVAQVAGGVAHEFNNRLTAIMGNLQLLDMRMRRQGVNLKYLSAAIRQAEDCGVLVNQLQAYASGKSIQTAAVDLKRALNDVIDAAATPAGVSLDLSAPEDLPAVTANATELAAAFDAILRNACEAMDGKGKIEVSVFAIPDPSAGADGAIASIDVVFRDTGPGIPVDMLDKVTQPFFTTKDVVAGAGLGLSAVLGFMNQIGGELHIANHPDGGVCVTLSFQPAEKSVAPCDGSRGMMLAS